MLGQDTPTCWLSSNLQSEGFQCPSKPTSVKNLVDYSHLNTPHMAGIFPEMILIHHNYRSALEIIGKTKLGRKLAQLSCRVNSLHRFPPVVHNICLAETRCPIVVGSFCFGVPKYKRYLWKMPLKDLPEEWKKKMHIIFQTNSSPEERCFVEKVINI